MRPVLSCLPHSKSWLANCKMTTDHWSWAFFQQVEGFLVLHLYTNCLSHTNVFEKVHCFLEGIISLGWPHIKSLLCLKHGSMSGSDHKNIVVKAGQYEKDNNGKCSCPARPLAPCLIQTMYNVPIKRKRQEKGCALLPAFIPHNACF